MTAWPVLLVLLASATPPVEVSMLNGDQHVGTLEKLSTDEVVLKTPTGSNKLAATELLSIRVPSVATIPATVSMFEVLLTDSTVLRVTKYHTTSTVATVSHPQMGELKLPLATIQAVRFAAPDSKVDGTWKQLLSKASRKDQVAIRKNDVLDHLDGVVGSIDETTVKFQLDGDDIPVKRERVFGLIYAKREAATAKTTASIETATGDHLSARTVSWDGENWKVKLATGTEITAPSASIQYVDYTQGKIAYLSNLEPRDVKYTPFFDISWDYRRDKCMDGRPISFGNKSYAKGLSLHSLTVLKYRSGGDYRRFQTVMGIDEHFSGNVDVVIKGDGRVLFKGPVRAGQPPQNLDLDVTGVVELEITVGFGEDELDIGDRLILADAKLVK